MKKILIIILFFLMISNVKAETYYSEYNDPLVSQNEIESSDTVKVTKEDYYKYYNNSIQLGDYYIEGNNPSEYPYIDKNDYKETPFTDWVRGDFVPALNRYIQTRHVIHYQVPEKIRYIHFYDFYGSYGSFRIPELKILYNNQELDYTYYCEGCNETFREYINNGTIYENMSNVSNGGYLRIDLKGFYDYSKIKIQMYLYDVEATTKRYTIDLTKTTTYGISSFFSKTFSSDYNHNEIEDVQLFSYDYSNLNIVNPIYHDYYVYNDDYTLYSYEYLQEEYTEYRYFDTLYRYYNLSRNYSEDYLNESNSIYPLKDETASITYYYYQTRDKVELMDNIVITDPNTKLEDFIITNTTNKCDVTFNQDITHNGVYEATFTFPFITVTKEVTVDILNNIGDLLDEINNLQDSIINLNQRIIILEEEKQNVLKELENKTNVNDSLYNDIEKLSSEINNLIIERNNNLTKLNNILDENEEIKDTINKQLIKIEELNQIINDLNLKNNQYSKIINQNKKYQKNINNLNQKIQIQEKETNNLKEEITNKTNEINLIKDRNNKKVDELTNLLDQANNEINNLSKRVNSNTNIKKESILISSIVIFLLFILIINKVKRKSN